MKDTIVSQTFYYAMPSYLETPVSLYLARPYLAPLYKGPLRQHAVHYAETGYYTTLSGIVPHDGALYNTM
jgi:hypothetical protein